MSKETKVAMQETFDLPLRGIIIDGDNIETNPTVTIRAMSTMEEKMRLSGNGYRTICNLIKSCILEPKGLRVEKMFAQDLNYMMYRLRALTYGSEYPIKTKCTECGRENSFNINLRDLPVETVEEDFNGTFELPQLPISKDVITCKLLTTEDEEKIEKESSRILRKYPEYVGDPQMIVQWTYKIVSINGNRTTDKNQIRRYIEELHAKDFQFLSSKYDDFEEKLGIDTHIFETCSTCGEDFDFYMPINSEFFRPRY